MGMTVELALKILANGLFFTPKAVVRDFGGVLTVYIYIVRSASFCQNYCGSFFKDRYQTVSKLGLPLSPSKQHLIMADHKSLNLPGSPIFL